ncbi:MAG: 6-carboxytetrahydropterin synthase [Planctomycetota bacterium]
MERWSIEIDKEYLKFSAAHFLIFPDGTAERLHGHNYHVRASIEARLTEHGLVMDFQHIKPVVRALVDELDEHWLVPGRHPDLSVEEAGDHVEVRWKSRRYRAPKDDVIVLPINNTSAENLSAYLGRRLLDELRDQYPDVEVARLVFKVQETAGQRGVWTFTPDGSRPRGWPA